MASRGEDSIAPVPKRSLFKKSAPVKPVEGDEGLQLFSRSKAVFPDVIAENERRRKDLESRRPKDSVDRKERGVPDQKRRRMSQESEGGSEGHSSDDEITARLLRGHRSPTATTTQPPRANSASTSPKQKRPTGSSSKSRQDSIDRNDSRKSETPQPTVISLSDSEDEITKLRNKIKHANSNLNLDNDVVEEDLKHPKAVISPVKEVFEAEEFPEYVAKAREGAARKVFGRLNPAKSNARSDSISSNESNNKLETPSNSHAVNASQPTPDPVVLILVSSQIEGTKPLVIKRKLSQRLKDVKIAWCDRQVLGGQPVSDETKRLIFLTWRGNKVFDVTTCKALGLTADASGKVRIDGEGFDDEGRIHLEAWTEEIFEDFRKRKAAERRRLVLHPMDEEEEDESTAANAEPEEKVQKFKIILKAKNSTEFKLQVVSSTAISKMIGAFRAHYKIQDGVNISLYLDGDKLDPNSIVADADLDELTTIDVHVG